MPRRTLAGMFGRRVDLHLSAGLVWCGNQLWQWTPLLFIAAALIGIGANAMFGDQYLVASTLYFIAIAILLAKAIAESRYQENRFIISVAITIFFVLTFVACLWLTRRIDLRKLEERSAVSTPSRWLEIDSGQISDFISALHSQVGVREQVRLGCAAFSEQTCVDSSKFLDLFKRGGWHVQNDRIERVTTSKPAGGVRLFKYGYADAFNPDDPDQGKWVEQTESLLTLRKAFAKIGIIAETAADEQMPQGVIGVFFGIDPRSGVRPSSHTTTMPYWTVLIFGTIVLVAIAGAVSFTNRGLSATPDFRILDRTAFPHLIELDANVFRTSNRRSGANLIFPIVVGFENGSDLNGFPETDNVCASIRYRERGFEDNEIARANTGCWIDEPLADIRLPYRRARFLFLGGWMLGPSRRPLNNTFTVFQYSRDLYRPVEVVEKMATPRELLVEVTLTATGRPRSQCKYEFDVKLARVDQRTGVVGFQIEMIRKT